MTQFLSKGKRVPSPLFLAHGLLSSHEKVSSNCFFMVGGISSIFSRQREASSFHPLALKSKNHWSSKTATMIFPPLLEKALWEVSYITLASFFLIISCLILSFASITFIPEYFPQILSITPL